MSIYLGGGVGTALFAAFFSITSGAPGKSFSLLSIPEFTNGFSAALLLAIAISVITVLMSFAVKDSDTIPLEADTSETDDRGKPSKPL